MSKAKLLEALDNALAEIDRRPIQVLLNGNWDIGEFRDPGKIGFCLSKSKMEIICSDGFILQFQNAGSVKVIYTGPKVP